MTWAWSEIHWDTQPLAADATGLLQNLAADTERGPCIIELRVEKGRVRYLVGAEKSTLARVERSILGLIPAARTSKMTSPRTAVERAGRLTIKGQRLSLRADTDYQALRSLLSAASSATRDGDIVVLQTVLGAGVPPHGIGSQPQDPSQSWLDAAIRGIKPATSRVSRGLEHKAGQYRFRAVVRLGVTGKSPPRRRLLVFAVLAALRQLETADSHIRLTHDNPDSLNEAIIPARKPLRLAPAEVLSLLAWPVGDRRLPGTPSQHPRQLPPPASYAAPSDRIFAVSSAPGSSQTVGVGIEDSLRHLHAVGPTGVGKSTILLHLIASDIAAGRSVVVIDPKRDLALDALSLVPPERRADVVVLDPTLKAPVGLNPLADATRDPALAADGLLALFKGLFPSMFGPRTSDAVHASLLTLAHVPGSTIADLPRLFADAGYRRRVLARVADPLGIGAFWTSYDALSPPQQAALVGPVMTRLRQFLLRPGIRAVVDQASPRFDLADLFTKPRIFIVTLNKGLLGSEAASLLGSMVVTQLWQHTLRRAAVPASERTPVSVYVDEAQSFLHLSDLAEALEQSRSLKVAWHLAHQHRAQMPAPLLAAIDANTRSKILFTLEAADAVAITQRSVLKPEDVMALPPYEIYANLEHNSARTGWFSARTLPPPVALSDPFTVLAESQARYGCLPQAHEAAATSTSVAVIPAPGEVQAVSTPLPSDEAIGRRRKDGQ